MKPDNKQSPNAKIHNLYCENLQCKKFICRTDGVRLLVENLEVEVKTKTGKYRKGRRRKTFITCPYCGFRTAWWHEQNPDKQDKSESEKKGKFSIFKSRF